MCLYLCQICIVSLSGKLLVMKILGIETSCDETAAAVVEDGYKLLSNVVASSMDLHAHYGGVIPEIAARSHIEVILPVIQQALDDANCAWDDIDAIAVTYGAGLGGSLLIGVLTARTLAIAHNKPLYAANHVMGHVFANFLTSTSLPGYTMRSAQPAFPMLAIIVSGGHSQLALFRSYFDYTLLGQTQDDAIGEAFDKMAKITGLPYPGGPSVAKAAERGIGQRALVLRIGKTALRIGLPDFQHAVRHHGAIAVEHPALDADAFTGHVSRDQIVGKGVIPLVGVARCQPISEVRTDGLRRSNS